ncbi:unnamed protein product [Brassica rapa]|uniref:Uncharacterized protein n=1 Tax=Brassica campestris TaxID=3711 RepID=A0A3P5ZW66_BRACM|nr:unnamed protein product [Brassica rapa]VDC76218.1 unnamed protein product [Brassica rapa]
MYLSSTNIHFDYDGHYYKCGHDYEWIPTDAHLKKAHVVGTMVSVRVDMEKKRMWALIWNRRSTMNIPRRNTRVVGCKPFTFSSNVFTVWER